MNREILETVLRASRKNMAWLTNLIENGISHSDAVELEILAGDPWTATAPKTYELPKVDPAWARERREEYLTDECAIIRRNLVDARIDLAREQDPIVSILIEQRIGAIIKNLKRREAELASIKSPSSGSVTDDQIRVARGKSIMEILDTKTVRIMCPFHDDDKSAASIKTGKLHCFSCGANVDAIGYLMKIKGLSFPEAVRRLQ